MSDSLRDPPRWKDRPDQSDVAERAAGNAFRCASALPHRAAPPLSRVAARLRATRTPRRLTWALAATAFILGLATAASAAHFNLLPSWLIDLMHPGSKTPAGDHGRPRPAKRAKAPATTTPPALPVPAGAEATPVPPPAAPAVTATPAPMVAESLPPAPPPAPRKVALAERTQRGPSSPASTNTTATPRSLAGMAPALHTPIPDMPSPAPSPWPSAAVPAPVPPSSQPATPPPPPTGPTEAPPSIAPTPAPAQGVGKYLTEAIHMLRKAHAPASALQLLDRHEPALAQAGFAHEALILRVEALLALGRQAEVLRLLDGASLTDVAASRALLVTRGELRAAANRCSDGIGDFELVLARSRQPDRRALVGRALCRKRMGDLPGARADLQRLRDEFPYERVPAELEK